YMSVAKPVCAVLNGEGAAIVEEARNGVTVAAGNVELLVEKVLELSKCSKAELEHLGKNGLDYYNRYFRKDICMNNLYHIMNL
ncbi:MAG: glycosyltransferase WbuB, partial [Odoribacter sp.]|nr:glycosyltransferase WbuB [Odoribacter sp.]